MVKIDREKVYTRFREIEDSLQRLREFHDVSVDAFLKDRDKQDIASFRLIVAIEAAIDICMHVAAKAFHKVAGDYTGCFVLLAETGMIPEDLSDRLARMARFRNLLVHRYWDIDYGQMYKIITGPDLADLEEFVRRVTLWAWDGR